MGAGLRGGHRLSAVFQAPHHPFAESETKLVCNLFGCSNGFPLTSLVALGILCGINPLAQGPAVKPSSIPRKPFAGTGLASGLVVILGLLAGIAHAAGTASEQANVDVMIRQLNAVEAVARRSAELPSDGSSRYHLDYNRLAADIARIR